MAGQRAGSLAAQSSGARCRARCPRLGLLCMLAHALQLYRAAQRTAWQVGGGGTAGRKTCAVREAICCQSAGGNVSDGAGGVPPPTVPGSAEPQLSIQLPASSFTAAQCHHTVQQLHTPPHQNHQASYGHCSRLRSSLSRGFSQCRAPCQQACSRADPGDLGRGCVGDQPLGSVRLVADSAQGTHKCGFSNVARWHLRPSATTNNRAAP